MLWTYLLCVASFGVYALVWVYRAARRVGGRDSSGAAAWAAGSLAAPIACLVLYELSGRARAELRARGERSLPAWVAPVLHGAMAALLLWTPLYGFWSPLWLLLPIPLALAHGELRRATAGAEAPGRTQARAWRGRVLEVAIVALGLPLAGLAAFRLDAATARLLLAERENGVVRGVGAGYQLTIEDPLWRRLPPGTIGDPDADLELQSLDRTSWLIVYVHPAAARIDDVVDARRALIAGGEALEELEEHRYLLPADEILPASLARYRVGVKLARAEYQVLTAHVGEALVEAVAFTASPDQHAGRLASLLATFAPAALGPEPSP